MPRLWQVLDRHTLLEISPLIADTLSIELVLVSRRLLFLRQHQNFLVCCLKIGLDMIRLDYCLCMCSILATCLVDQPMTILVLLSREIVADYMYSQSTTIKRRNGHNQRRSRPALAVGYDPNRCRVGLLVVPSQRAEGVHVATEAHGRW